MTITPNTKEIRRVFELEAAYMAFYFLQSYGFPFDLFKDIFDGLSTGTQMKMIVNFNKKYGVYAQNIKNK